MPLINNPVGPEAVLYIFSLFSGNFNNLTTFCESISEGILFFLENSVKLIVLLSASKLCAPLKKYNA